MEGETPKYSYQYEKLPQEEKDKVDAILSYLVGMNTREAKLLVMAVDEELVYRSTVLQ